MSTHIERLRRSEELDVWESDIPGRRQPLRRLYAAKELQGWLPRVWQLRSVGRHATIGAELTEFVDQFVMGGSMAGWCHRVMPDKHGIWAVSTREVRLFGFFLAQNCLILTHGDLASNTHGTRGKPATHSKTKHMQSVREYCQRHGIPDAHLLRGDHRHVFLLED